MGGGGGDLDLDQDLDLVGGGGGDICRLTSSTSESSPDKVHREIWKKENQ